MQATLARLEIQPPDWGQVGTVLGTVLATAVLALMARLRSNGNGVPGSNGAKLPKPAPLTPGVAPAGPQPIEVLQELVGTLQDENERLRGENGRRAAENERLWARLGEYEQREQERERRANQRDGAIDELHNENRRLRALLVRNNIDPGREG